MGLLLFPVPCLNRTFLFPVSLNEWNLPIRRFRNRQWQSFFQETGAWAVRQHKVHTKHDE
ncbi:hypothetical protein CXT96_11725 [Akkermansia muciniphila]|nr:hypothetical protein CXT92_10555 [Akkermansia muciniphila]PNC91949.1 hypothetical protein CXT91_03480 [Akkermansia muciniphila]PND12333.1 hypothetical protein CXT96_11725 [Akkermansia muciniphila]